MPACAQGGVGQVEVPCTDLHDTGLYTWAYLRELGDRKDELMQAYVANLARAGLTREP